MTPSLGHAVVDNVEWCDLVCRSLDLATGRSDRLWWCADEAPTFYPDVITTTPETPLDPLLGLLDDRPRCSVKDSYATLDLSGEGFEVVCEATWIARAPGVPAGADPGWELIGADGLAEWEQAWLSAGGAPASMSAVLLADAPVAFVSDRRDGRIAAGAVVHRGTGVLGLSNVFEAPGSSDEAGASDGAGWRAAASAASWLAPELGVVGYERDAWLSTALTIGFRPVGPLIIWQRG